MSDIEQIELTISEAKKIVATRDAALRLASNRDFKKIFLEGYFKDEAARLVGISADPVMLDQGQGEHIDMEIRSISCTQQYLRGLVQQGDLAERSISEHTEMLAEMEMTEVADV